MGRYAYFNCSNKSDSAIEYKFWVGTQDSVIPWADTLHEYSISEYDEDTADQNDFTDTQKKIWQEWSESYIPMDQILSDDEKVVINSCSMDQHTANDTDSKLQEYWQEVNTLIAENNLTPFKFDETLDIEDQLYQYVENVLINSYSAHDSKKETIAADIHLKLLICCILQTEGSYSCIYEW